MTGACTMTKILIVHYRQDVYMGINNLLATPYYSWQCKFTVVQSRPSYMYIANIHAVLQTAWMLLLLAACCAVSVVAS